MVTATGSTIDPSTVLRGVTVRGGTATNGGGIYIADAASPLIENCEVSGNVATSSGGGLYVFQTNALALRDTVVMSNTAARQGGGMYQTYVGGSRLDLFGGRFENNETTENNGGGLWIFGTVAMTGTEFINNRAAYRGGGFYQMGSTGRAEVTGALLEGNTANTFFGGGLGVEGTAVLSATRVIDNRAGQHGGGVWANYAYVTGAILANNRSGLRGGGLLADYGVVMTATSVINNAASQQGGGVAAYRHVDIVNSLFARNSSFAGAAVWMWGTDAVEARLRHLTVVSPTVGTAYPSAAAFLVHGGTTALITNTIVVGYPYAIEAFQGGTVYEDYNLYHGLGTSPFNETGGVVHTGAHSLFDLDPLFVNPGEDDYHIGAGSPAINAGIDLGITEDLDGDPRVPGLPPDIGADEFVPPMNQPPVADAGDPQTVHAGTVTLDGSGSLDPDGDDLLYQWVQTAGAAVTLSDSTAVGPTFTAPSVAGVLTFELTVTDPFGLEDTDSTTVTISVTLPELTILKSGSAEAMAGELITYTLVITNRGSVAASSLVITDALPSGASFVSASDDGSFVGDLVSWTVLSLGPGESLIRTFAVTATETITNARYGVSSAEGVSAEGKVAVVTEVKRAYRLYLALVTR